MKTTISKTGEGELLVSKEDGSGGFMNIIVDEDGDIEIMHIPSDRKETWHKSNVSVDEAIEFWNSQPQRPKCPECLQPTTQEELNMFGGLCEECASAMNEE